MGTYRGIGVDLEFRGDTTKLNKAIKEVDSDLKKIDTNLGKVNKSLKLNPANTELMEQKFDFLAKAISTTTERLNALRSVEQKVKSQFESGKIDQSQYIDFQAEVQKTESRLKSLQAEGIKTVSVVTGDLKNAFNDLKTTVSGAVKVITAAETALVAFSAKAVSTGMTFDKAMSNVEAISGATADEMEVLRNKAQEMGADTVYSASEAAEALSYMALAGWDTQSMLEGISPVLDLAAASAMDLGTASDIVTDYLTAFGLEASDAANFVDIMAYAMSNSNTTTSQLGEAYKNCAATSASLGYSVEETTAVLMAMSNAGVKGGEAGTALNAVMTRLATDTKDCATALAEYGVNVYDANGNMNSLSSILEGMSDVWDDLSDAEQANLAKTIAGTSHYSALQTIMTGCSETAKESGQSFSDYAAALGDCAGAAENMSEIMVDNLQGDLTILKSAFEGLQIAISDKLTPSLRSAAQEGTDFLGELTEEIENGRLAEAFESLGESISKLIKGGISVAAEELPRIINFLTYIIEHINKIISLFVAMKSAAALKSVMTNVSKLVTSFLSLRTAIQSATTAQEAFNAVSSASLIGIAANALAVIIGLFTNYALSVDSAIEETVKLTDAQREGVAAVNELTDSLNESKKARAETAQATEEEYDGYQALVDKLYALNDQEKQTAEQKAEMLGIIEKLNTAIPNLNLSIDDETGKLNQQKDAVEALIQSKKDLAVVNSAINNLAELEIEKEKAQKAYDEAEQNYIEAKQLAAQTQSAFQQANADYLAGTPTANVRELKKAAEEAEGAAYKMAETYNSAAAALHSVNEESKLYEDILSEYSDKLEDTTANNDEFSDSLENAADATEDLSEAEETLAEKFDKAKSAVSTTRSELSEYLNLLKEVNNNTKYSTAQILELIEKYPELAGAIRLTSDGYTLEKKAVEELVKAKSAKLEQDALEALNLAEKNYWDIAKSGHATSAEEETAYNAWKQAKNTYNEMKKVTSSINSGDIVYSTNPSSTEKSDTTDYWKQAAENEIAEAEHLYNMGEISAEEYYDKLADINRRYYENKAEYLNEYNNLAEKVYNGLKKAQEDDISNAKTLEERIRAVQEAQTKLKNADKQEVSVYSSAAGFHSEKNTSAIMEAQQSLYDAKYDLAETLLKLGKFDGSSISSQIGSLNISKLQNMLPDLSRLSIPTSANAVTQQNSPQTPKEYNITVNYTSGDIILQGAVDEITVARVKRLMQSEFKELFLKCMTEYLNQANLERMTGG